MFDLSKLKGRIIEVCGTQGEFAKRMNWSERTTTQKLTGKVAWTQTDIQKALEVLGLDDTDINVYFFTLKVQKSELEEG